MASMAMSRFRSEHREANIDGIKRKYGYLKKFSSAACQVRVDTTKFEELPEP
jgi:hypothetical protein